MPRTRCAAPGRARLPGRSTGPLAGTLTGLLAVLSAVCWLLLPAAATARADDPVELSRDGQITDRVGALGDRTGQVEDALDRLYADERIQLFVVYVRDFSGRSGQTWSDETANRNGLGQDDVLLSVATHDRQYAYSVDAGSPLTDEQLREVAGTAIEPALRENDWAGAAIGAADGYGSALAGRPVTAPAITPGPADPGTGDSGSAGARDFILPAALVVGVGAVGAYAYTRRKRRTTTRTTPAATGWGRGPGEGGAPEPPTPLPELDGQVKEVLVDTDDAVRTSEEELGFATAQFGEDAAGPFTKAVARAKDELTQSFRLRQQLDDAFPEDDATRRRMLEEILRRCATANEGLDAVSEDFDRLRALERTAPEALATVDATHSDLAGRVAAAESGVTGLRERYGEGVAAPVAADVEQAKDRLVFAASAVGQARTAVEGGENSRAAVYIRGAEGAVGQAGTLLDSVDRRAAELGEAARKLPAALTETETDLADAGGLLEGTAEGASTADLRGRIARAEAVLGDVRAATAAGPYDPVDALRRVEEADAALDEALAGARDQERGEAKARTLLDQAMLTARSAIGAAADYITTHRGAVGSQARTRLAEAQRRWERARELSATDAQGALAEVRQADALAGQAMSLAEQDVRGFGGMRGPGPMGGGGGGMGGAVLGGILLGGLFGGGGRGGGMGGGFGGGFGGGGRSGGFGGGPGSFGGGGTRGRRGGGGRF
ncbi:MULTISPECIES: TPM domain-containing protein [unclassified Streptomyces]|uniref:TPM domain-containing protein n=1 Tax=unclassified Streptomyces TaxID=2593676 RepID=UPI0035B1BF57